MYQNHIHPAAIQPIIHKSQRQILAFSLSTKEPSAYIHGTSSSQLHSKLFIDFPELPICFSSSIQLFSDCVQLFSDCANIKDNEN